MGEQAHFEMAAEIASKISAKCESAKASMIMLSLVEKLLEIRWSFTPKPS